MVSKGHTFAPSVDSNASATTTEVCSSTPYENGIAI